MKTTLSSLLVLLLIGPMGLAKAQVAACNAESPCEVSLDHVASEPAAFDGIHVKMKGFLHQSGDDLLLFRSQEASAEPQGAGALLVSNDPVAARLVFGAARMDGWAVVSGLFVAARPERLPGVSGVIEDPVIMVSSADKTIREDSGEP